MILWGTFILCYRTNNNEFLQMELNSLSRGSLQGCADPINCRYIVAGSRVGNTKSRRWRRPDNDRRNIQSR